MSSAVAALQQAVGWLHVLVSLAGVVVCALNLDRSRWVWLLLGGFALDTFVSAAFRVSSLLMTRSGMDYAAFGTLLLMLSFLGIVGSVSIVAGLAFLLREVSGGTKPARPPVVA